VRVTIEENIDIENFITELICCFKEDLVNMIPNDFKDIIELRMDDNGNLVGIKIDKRIHLQESWGEDSQYYVDCIEKISFDKMKKVFKHDKFTFHYVDISGATKDFRIDYKPYVKVGSPLHAHDHEYKKSNFNHLEFPHNVSLYLAGIDIITELLILKRYLLTQEEYPIDKNYSKEYNNIIKRTRRKYDDKLQCELF
jgi:hypothetical protein